MIGTKVREFKTHKNISLDDLVPENNFYRQLEDCINLAHRWYLGYDLDESLPDHSSLSKIRDRFGLGVFQSFFEEIVQLCSEAGLVWGEELYFDSTKVQANASINGMVERTEYEANHHLDELFPDNQPPSHPFEELIDKFDGNRITGIRKPTYQRVTDQQISPIDPHASPMPFPGRGSSVLGYRDHYVVDGGKARIILSALVTPASIMDNTPMLDLTNWVCSRWELEPEIVVVDAKYGTVPNIVGLEERGIKAYLLTSEFSKRTKYYPAKLFQYVPENDPYVCHQGQKLPLVTRRRTEQVFGY